MNGTTILLVGHGSRHSGANDEIERFGELWRQRQPDWHIEVCFIELAEVLLDEGLDRATRAAHKVVVVPLILGAAGHVKMEIPAAVNRARERHPLVDYVCVHHLGLGEELFGILRSQLKQVLKTLDALDPQTTGIILLGCGSSDSAANSELAKMARWIFEDGDHELVDIAFTGITLPRLESVVQHQARLGMMQIAIVPVYLFNGVLIDRIGRQVDRLTRRYPRISFSLGSYFGFDKGIFDLLERRVFGHDAGPGQLLECDGCKFKVPDRGHHHHHLNGKDHAHQ